MKIYTEEEIKRVLELFQHSSSDITLYLQELTPIELPSDDEIARVGLDFSVGYNVEYWNGFKHCGEWMKEQILKQNK